MPIVWRVRSLLVGLLGACFLTVILLAFNFPSSTTPMTGRQRFQLQQENAIRDRNLARDNHQILTHYQHKLAVIVPFRERFEELMIFAPHLHKFLLNQDVDHHIWIINQVDTYRFNRAALINVGFWEAKLDPNVTYMAMHDVDLLPLNSKLPYGYPGEQQAVHVAALHPKYEYPSFIGGILLLDMQDFQAVDGMSNIYWGWGMEDDEFWVRLKQHNIRVTKANGSEFGSTRKNTFRHIHSRKLRPRDQQKCYGQLEKTRKRDRVTGLHNVNYTLLSKVEMQIDSAPVTVVNVKLHCDKDLSPWCNCPPPENKPNSTQQKS